MNTSRLSKPATEALADARRRAQAAGHPCIEPEHLLAALLGGQDDRARSLLRDAHGALEEVEGNLARALSTLPRSHGAATTLASLSLERALRSAAGEAQRSGARQIGPDHLLLGLATPGISDRAALLQRCGVTADKLRPHAERTPQLSYR